MISNTETVKVDVKVKAVTDDALLLDNGLTETWFPKSQVLDDRVHTLERNEQAPDLRLAYWLAKKKGLI